MQMLRCGMFAAVALAVMSQAAVARDGCGSGRFFDGYRCRPYYADYGPRYGAPYARALRGQNSFGDPELWFAPRYDYSGNLRCPPGHTVQDGVCKLYRGY